MTHPAGCIDVRSACDELRRALGVSDGFVLVVLPRLRHRGTEERCGSVLSVDTGAEAAARKRGDEAHAGFVASGAAGQNRC